MKKICILLLGFLSFCFTAFSQKKSNPKIGTNEVELASFILSDDRIALGGQVVYRFALKTKTKIGAGGLCAADYEDIDFINASAYGAAFVDIMQFIGSRQKWSFSGQIGHGFSNRKIFGSRLKAGIYSSASANFRSIISKKLLLGVSLLIGYRNFHYANQYYPYANTPMLGLKVGIVF